MLRQHTINNELSTSHRFLIIGCGQSSHHAVSLHPPEQFFTVDMLDTNKPHLTGDITNQHVLDYLSQQKFELIAIECVPQLAVMLDNASRRALINHLFSLLADNGVLAIIASGNMYEDTNLYRTLTRHVDKFKLYCAYRRDMCLPNCTIIAAKTDMISEEAETYINHVLRLKHLGCRSIVRTEEMMVTRQSCYERSELKTSALLNNQGIYQPVRKRNSVSNAGISKETSSLLNDNNDEIQTSCCCLMM
jgi:hypothetical protein